MVGVRLAPAAQPLAAFVSMQAWLFVLGHEIAHHVLGHDSAASAFSPGEHLPACSADQQREVDADRLVHQALVCVQHKLGEGSDSARSACSPRCSHSTPPNRRCSSGSAPRIRSHPCAPPTWSTN